MDCHVFLWPRPGPLKKSQVHSRIQTQLPPLYLSSASDRTISTHSALRASLTPGTHCFLPEHLRTDHSTTQLPWPEIEAFLVYDMQVWFIFCDGFLKITTQFSKPEDQHFWKKQLSYLLSVKTEISTKSMPGQLCLLHPSWYFHQVSDTWFYGLWHTSWSHSNFLPTAVHIP